MYMMKHENFLLINNSELELLR